MKRQSGTMLPLYYLSTHSIILVLTRLYGMSIYLLGILHRRRRFCILLGALMKYLLEVCKWLRKYSIKASEAPVK